MAGLKMNLYPEPRQCIVEEKKALFHRWIEEEFLVFVFEITVSKYTMEQLKYECEKTGIIPAGIKTNNVKHTFGLVEFENGSIRKIAPENIKFIDGSLYFGEKVW